MKNYNYVIIITILVFFYLLWAYLSNYSFYGNELFYGGGVGSQGWYGSGEKWTDWYKGYMAPNRWTFYDPYYYQTTHPFNPYKYRHQFN